MSLNVYLIEDACPCCGVGNEVYSANITHNLNTMADKAGIYYALWRPEERNYKIASDIIPRLEYGIKTLKTNKSYYESFNSFNGWCTYEHFLLFVEEYLQSCKEHPNATIRISR